MVISNIYKMNWMKGPVIVNNLYQINGKIIHGDIIPVHDSLLRKAYNPFEYYENPSNMDSRNLYLQFIAIDESKVEGIISFVTEFGLPGIYVPFVETEYEELQKYTFQIELMLYNLDGVIKASNLKEIKAHAASICKEFKSMHYSKMVHNRDYLGKTLECEPIIEVIKDIWFFRCLVRLWESIKSKNVLDCIVCVKCLREYYSLYGTTNLFENNFENEKNFIPADAITEDCLFNPIIEQTFTRIFAGELNHKINLINPILSHDQSILDNTEIAGSWNTPTLLYAMYLMFYLDITKNKDIVKCHNETCRDYFIVHGNYKTKIYCDHACANIQAQRNFQKKKKMEKLKLK